MTMRSKKATGLSMNMIVIAVIALIILIVMIVIFSGKIGDVNKDTSDISGQYKECEIPGTTRTCRDVTTCNSMGGMSFGSSGCTSGICCSK